MLKIILTGSESSGKTTLARQLAVHFNAPLVEEYARTFFEKKGTPQYKQEDLMQIAQGQLNNELKIVNGESPITHHLSPITHHLSPITHHPSPMLICDTDLLTLKIWSNEVFDDCSPELIQLIDNQLIDCQSTFTSYYFLCSPEGINWEDDPLRENPHDRDRLFNIYEKELNFYEKKYSILRGSHEERLEKSIVIIKELLVKI